MKKFISTILVIVSISSLCACSGTGAAEPTAKQTLESSVSKDETDESYYVPQIIESICPDNDREIDWIVYYREDGQIDRCENYFYGGKGIVLSELITFNYDSNGKLQNAIWQWVDNEYSNEHYDDAEIYHCDYDVDGNLTKIIFRNTNNEVLTLKEFVNGNPVYAEEYQGDFYEFGTLLEVVELWFYHDDWSNDYHQKTVLKYEDYSDDAVPRKFVAEEKFNSKGDIISSSYYDELNNETQLKEFEYAANNLCIIETTSIIWNTGVQEKISTTNYTYDNKGNLIKEDTFYEDSGKESLTYYQYDDNDNLKNSTKVEKENGNVVSSIEEDSISTSDLIERYEEYYPNDILKLRVYFSDDIYGIGEVIDIGNKNYMW